MPRKQETATAESSPDRKSARKSKFRKVGFYLGGTMILLGLLLFLLPAIVAKVFVQEEAIAWLSGRAPGTLQVGNATLSWQGPLQLNEVTVNTPQGKPVAKVASITAAKSLWDLLTRPNETLRLNLKGVRVNVTVPEPRPPAGRLDVSQIVRTLQDAEIPTPDRPLELTLTDGQVDFLNPAGDVLDSWQGISGSYRFETADAVQQVVAINIPTPGDDAETASWKLNGQWEQNEQGERITIRSEGDHISLQAARPWLTHYLGPDNGLTACGGTVLGTFDRAAPSGWTLTAAVKMHGNQSLAEAPPGAVAFEESLPVIEFEIKSQFAAERDRLDIPRLRIAADESALIAAGEVTELSGQENLDVRAKVQTPAQPMEFLPADLREKFQVKGLNVSEFQITGPLQAPSGNAAQALTLQTRVTWDEANLYGMRSSQGEIAVALRDGLVTLTPHDVRIGGGRLLRLPNVSLKTSPPTLLFAEGPMLEDVELTEELCRDWMKFVSPTLANATAADGRFSLTMNAGELPIGDAEHGTLSGRLDIQNGQVRPGPLAVEILGKVEQVQSLVLRGGGGNLAQQAWMTIPEQPVTFQLQNGRVHHDRFRFEVRDAPLATTGSVGLDQSLDLRLGMEIPRQWLQGAGPILSALQGESIQLRIAGTIDEPDIDASPLADFGKRIGIKAGAGLLERILERRRGR